LKLPIRWIEEYVKLPKNISTDKIVETLVKIGFEVESVEIFGGVDGPLVVGQVESIEVLTEYKKPIRYCIVNVGNKKQEIICGASNFQVSDQVVVALPGSVLPGDFKITERETYGKISQGMICSAREIGFSESHEGIIVLAEKYKNGQDAKGLLGLGEVVLDISVLPDRGYAMSVRGIARELATALGVDFVDPAKVKISKPKKSSKLKVSLKTKDASKIALVFLKNYDPQSVTPMFMQKRLAQVGFRSISLPVDITNYLMIEIGQPLHAFDSDKISGGIQIRAAKPNEKIETLDHVKRSLKSNDLVIADSTKALSIAGVMGGLESEITTQTTNLIIESAIFDRGTISGTARFHKLISEASKRFERGTDDEINEICAVRCADLLVKYGKAQIVGMALTAKKIFKNKTSFDLAEIKRLIGFEIPNKEIEKIFTSLQIVISKKGKIWILTPPSWRHDLLNSADYVEEIIRIWGYEKIPTQLPQTVLGKGLNKQQLNKKNISIKLSSLGLNEVLNYPFIGLNQLDDLNIDGKDIRKNVVKLANPLSEQSPFLRTSLLPGLIGALTRNISRGIDDLALFEQGSVFFLNKAGPIKTSPAVGKRPAVAEIKNINDHLPFQPTYISGILYGNIQTQGWGISAREYQWQDSIEIVRQLFFEFGIQINLKNTKFAPFHPGRCAEILIEGHVVGHAGEFAPSVTEKIGLNGKVFAFEINKNYIDQFSEIHKAPLVSAMPVMKEDLAFVVNQNVKANEVRKTIQSVNLDLIESVNLFDVYQGTNIEKDKKSLAFNLRLRASDSTISTEVASQLRQEIIAKVHSQHGGTLRA
jgi:phenylalanyl-tRNA synthetase beta chain